MAMISLKWMTGHFRSDVKVRDIIWGDYEEGHHLMAGVGLGAGGGGAGGGFLSLPQPFRTSLRMLQSI